MIKITDNSGRYETEGIRKSLLSRLSPSLYFYAHIIGIVMKGSALAKKGLYDDGKRFISSFGTMRAMERTGVRFHIDGANNIEKIAGPCVFISNHMSTLETFVLPSLIVPHKKVTFILKKSLLTYPLFGNIMRSLEPVSVGRKNPREDLETVLREGADRLQRGISIIVFPQTTRSAYFDESGFNTIGIKLAKRACVPVIPVALKTDAWGNGRLIKDFGMIYTDKDVYISLGEPINIAGRGSEGHRAVMDFIKERLRLWGVQSGPKS